MEMNELVFNATFSLPPVLVSLILFRWSLNDPSHVQTWQLARFSLFFFVFLCFLFLLLYYIVFYWLVHLNRSDWLEAVVVLTPEAARLVIYRLVSSGFHPIRPTPIHLHWGNVSVAGASGAPLSNY